MQFLKLQTPQVCSLLAGSHYNAIMYLAALSVESDCCADRYQVEQIAVLHMTQCPSAPIMCALSFFFSSFLLLSALKPSHSFLSAFWKLEHENAGAGT